MYSKFMNFLVTLMLVISCTALMVMMMLTAADVGMRYFLNSPLVWANELTEICMGFMVPAAVAYCSFKGAHVSVDLIYMHLPNVLKKIVYIFAEGIVTLTMGILCWKSFDTIDELIMMNTITPDLGLPMWPIAVFFVFSFGLTTVITFTSVLKGDQA